MTSRPLWHSSAVCAVCLATALASPMAGAQQASAPAATPEGATPAAAAPAQPHVSAATAFFESMRSNHAPGLAKPAASAPAATPAAATAPPVAASPAASVAAPAAAVPEPAVAAPAPTPAAAVAAAPEPALAPAPVPAAEASAPASVAAAPVAAAPEPAATASAAAAPATPAVPVATTAEPVPAPSPETPAAAPAPAAVPVATLTATPAEPSAPAASMAVASAVEPAPTSQPGVAAVPAVAAPAVAAAAPDLDARPEPRRVGHGIFKHEKAPKLFPVTVQRGVLTVDGWTGKADLNYQIADLRYLYFWVPGTGIVIVAHEPFSGSKFQPLAFDGNTLTVKVEDHQIQLTSEHRLLNVKTDEGVYVSVDHNGVGTGNFPQFGFGETRAAYTWPGSLADDKVNPNAPPLPASLRPKVETVQLCRTNPDGSRSDCHDVAVPMAAGKS